MSVAGHDDYEKLSHFQQCIVNLYSYNWKYNDIVGYIVVHLIQNDTIGFDLYWANKRKIRRDGRYKIEYKEYFNSMYINLSDKTDYSTLGNVILENINIIKKRRDFKDRYIETNYFEKIKDAINWKIFINNCKSK